MCDLDRLPPARRPKLRRKRLRTAAAAGWRRHAGQLQVAVVSTADGRRWVLPKGRVGRKEHPAAAAAREAREEAGLVGRVEMDPVAVVDDGRVAVFLLAVEGQVDADEDRTLVWASPAVAARLLASGRGTASAGRWHAALGAALAALAAGGSCDVAGR